MEYFEYIAGLGIVFLAIFASVRMIMNSEVMRESEGRSQQSAFRGVHSVPRSAVPGTQARRVSPPQASQPAQTTSAASSGNTDSFPLSMAVGAATGSTALGYLAGGSLLGASLGSSFKHSSDLSSSAKRDEDSDWRNEREHRLSGGASRAGSSERRPSDTGGSTDSSGAMEAQDPNPYMCTKSFHSDSSSADSYSSSSSYESSSSSSSESSSSSDSGGSDGGGD